MIDLTVRHRDSRLTVTNIMGAEREGPTVAIVCFDLGGVLVRLRRSWFEVCRAAGFDSRGDAALDRAQKALDDATAPYVIGRVSHDEWVARSVEALGGLYTAEEIARIHDEWIAGEYEGVPSLIDDLHAAGVATACLSNTNHAHWERFARAGEYPGVARLRARYASHVIGLSKPNQAIYRAFERATGHASERVLFFDDLWLNVEAAKSVGWNAERIDPNTETVPQMRRHLTRYGIVLPERR
jgi:putative hydrolase of the HAD superfamily